MAWRVGFKRLQVLVLSVLWLIASPVFAEEAGGPAWGFRFTVPDGWKCQASIHGAVLGHSVTPGLIIVLPHQLASIDEVRKQLQIGIQDATLQLYPSTAPATVSAGVIGGYFTGTYDGQQVKARALGACSPSGEGGAFVIALTYPAKYTAQLAAAADVIAAGIRYEKSEKSAGNEELLRHFTGTWVRISANSIAKVTLYANGTYRDYAESIYSGKYTIASQGQGGGRWTVRGTLQQGTMTFTDQVGAQSTLEYRVNTEKGKVYWNEYWIDGKLYGKQ